MCAIFGSQNMQNPVLSYMPVCFVLEIVTSGITSSYMILPLMLS